MLPMATDWITTAEAVKLTGYHPKHIHRLLRAGEIEGKKWSREWQISKSSLLRHIQKIEKLGEKRGPKTSS